MRFWVKRNRVTIHVVVGCARSLFLIAIEKGTFNTFRSKFTIYRINQLKTYFFSGHKFFTSKFEIPLYLEIESSYNNHTMRFYLYYLIITYCGWPLLSHAFKSNTNVEMWSDFNNRAWITNALNCGHLYAYVKFFTARDAILNCVFWKLNKEKTIYSFEFEALWT